MPLHRGGTNNAGGLSGPFFDAGRIVGKSEFTKDEVTRR